MTLRHWARRLTLAVAVLSPFACAMPPAQEDLLGDRDAVGTLLAGCESQLPDTVLEQAASTPQRRLFIRRINALETALTRKPLIPGNRVQLLIDGPETHGAQLEAIRRARHSIHMTTYIITDDRIGHRYLKALGERARAGVKVRLMFDSIGGQEAGAEFRQQLEAAGVELHEYAPANPLKDPEVWRVTHRNHRKLLIVDGRVAFTGGINISDEYLHSSHAGSGSRSSGGFLSKGKGVAHGSWRDTHIRVEGPAVAEFQRVFLDMWKKEHGPIEDDAHYWPVLKERGHDLVRVVAQNGNDLQGALLEPLLPSGGGRKPKFAIYGSYMAAIGEAHERVWITQAYFVPNSEFMEALERAAKRGVDVRLLVAGQSDIGLILHASRRHYAELLEAGVHIFEYHGPVLHAKTAVIDGVWSTVGSSNLDYRSFIHNDEANAIVLGEDFAADMERTFRDDLQRSQEIDPAAWKDRPLLDRIKQQATVLLKYWI
ncbi:MAG TPA: phospholipase D-like domain-containing protein [Candidatus Binatia bacterium]|nr:phospholipase D-like domain-containing protein [Candidatus Binatia bacterium]